VWAAILTLAVAAVVFAVTAVEAVRTNPPGSERTSGEGVAPAPVAGAEEGQARVPLDPGEVSAGEASEEAGEPALPPAAAQEARVTGYPLVSLGEIVQAVNRDLFQPDRTPPLERYLLPNQRPEMEAFSRNDRRRREPDLRIVGTAISGDLAIALVQLEDSIPFAVVQGEEVDGFLVAEVGEESVTLWDGEGEFTFSVTEPDRNQRSSRDRGRESRDDQGQAEAARLLNERIQQMLRGMGRGQGMPGGAMTGADAVELPVRLQELQRAGRIPANVIIRTRPGGGGGNQP
jgi:hypothetical protein